MHIQDAGGDADDINAGHFGIRAAAGATAGRLRRGGRGQIRGRGWGRRYVEIGISGRFGGLRSHPETDPFIHSGGPSDQARLSNRY